jgi:hypothetical protein
VRLFLVLVIVSNHNCSLSRRKSSLKTLNIFSYQDMKESKQTLRIIMGKLAIDGGPWEGVERTIALP